ncbi:hypothetical protein RRG08_019553 [Elysia crispata]|uniref:Uncharacterized protein n=1 Tax=Elysia crispata TaxID=231223 RepID=A0AAE0YX04_9GAST|nr:hypothetical protein RRG08_019553 [Elysia crispata]
MGSREKLPVSDAQMIGMAAIGFSYSLILRVWQMLAREKIRSTRLGIHCQHRLWVFAPEILVEDDWEINGQT